MKMYRFRFTVMPAEFRDGMVSVSFGLAQDNDLVREVGEYTLPAALVHLQELSDATPGPHAAMLSMASSSERKPPGFNQAKRTIYKEKVL